jgi:hypothetical protein
MALKDDGRIDRRSAMVGVLAAAGGLLVPPMRARAVGDPTPDKAYAAFFMGQGGYLFSWGIPYLAAQARALGIEADIFDYTDVNPAWKKIVRKKRDGYKVVLVGYSLGNTTITYLQRHLEVDLLLAISESSLGRNHQIKKEHTKRSVLWYGPDFLSNAGLKDGFDKINYVNDLHLWMDVDPYVVNGVLDELKTLLELEKIEAAAAAARAAQPVAALAQNDGALAPAPTPVRGVPLGWLPPTGTLTPDVTCFECWGFEISLSGPPGFEP